MVTTEQVMREVNNFFGVSFLEGSFAIENGTINCEVPVGAYIYVSGSMMNDGLHHMDVVHRFEHDEEFEGRVWFCQPPRTFIALCEEIAAYDAKNPTGAYISESFGGYSYNRGSGSSSTGTASPWQQAFSVALRPYRRMYTEVI